MEKIYNVEGMTCSSCAAAVQRILLRIQTITIAEVNLVLNQVRIVSDDEIPFEECKQALKKGGFELSEIITLKTIQLHIDGMSCASCSAAVERILQRSEGVASASVNLVMNTAQVIYDAGSIKLPEILEKINKAGFVASVKHQEEIVTPTKKRYVGMYITLAVAFVLLYIGMSHMLGSIELPLPKSIHYEHNPINFAGIQLLLATYILIIGRNFFTHGITSLFHGNPNMDTLVAIGTGSAYIYSVYSFIQLLQGDVHAVHRLYFESAGVVVALVMFGKHLEHMSKEKTTGAINALLSLRPQETILYKDGKEMIIGIDEVALHDILVVKAGDHIPLDGKIIEGFSCVDESMLTGESMPVDKSIDDKVIGGTINLDGRLLLKVEALQEDTMLSKIIKMVADAQAKKAPIARIADKISLVFVPTVMVIAIVAALLWYMVNNDVSFALTIFVSVLVIACPCALGLATPTAIMVGTGKAAQMGIFIKSGEALEQACHVDTIVFDKTGTLTIGKPVVSEIVSKHADEDVLRVATSLEMGSKHPIAIAIITKAKEMNLDIDVADELQTINGKGLIGCLLTQKVRVGNRLFMQEDNLDTSPFEQNEQALLKQGKSVIWVALGNEIIGLIAIADEIKKESKEVVQALQKQGIDVIMISGDHLITAQAIAEKAGIHHVIAQVLPQGKADEIAKLQQAGKKVAMVGDGINDAVALSKSEVGIAIGSGSDVAVESADIVLVKDDLHDVLHAIRLSKAVIRNIKQNLFWAFFYNTAGIPLAAGVLYALGGPLLSPVFAGAAMAFSSVSVVSNALRLRMFK